MSESVDNFAADIVIVVDVESVDMFNDSMILNTWDDFYNIFKDIRFTYRGMCTSQKILARLKRENDKNAHFTPVGKMANLVYRFN